MSQTYIGACSKTGVLGDLEAHLPGPVGSRRLVHACGWKHVVLADLVEQISTAMS